MSIKHLKKMYAKAMPYLKKIDWALISMVWRLWRLGFNKQAIKGYVMLDFGWRLNHK